MGDFDEPVSEVIREGAEEVVKLSRAFTGPAVGGAFVIGAGLGGALGFIFAKRKLETKYSKLADEEITVMREHYQAKTVAMENTVDKPKLDELVRDHGYAPEDVGPPMAVTPPSAVVEAAEEGRDEPEQPPAAVAASEVRNVFRDNEPPEDDWDWHKERSQRSPLKPYVIHREERDEQDAYDAVTFTYYDADDVVCNERDEVIPEGDRERIIGEAHLEKFGHGSDDPSIVYIRNDHLEMDIEVVRSPNSYAEEVHGFEPEIRHAEPLRRRWTFDDDDDDD